MSTASINLFGLTKYFGSSLIVRQIVFKWCSSNANRKDSPDPDLQQHKAVEDWPFIEDRQLIHFCGIQRCSTCYHFEYITLGRRQVIGGCLTQYGICIRLFILSSTLLFYKAYPILVIHFCHNPRFTFKALLLRVIIVNIEGIFTPDLGGNLLLT